MQKISVPYEIRDKRLFMQELIWPSNCACCMENNSNSKYCLNLRLMAEDDTKEYSLTWNVPYCRDCINHTGKKSQILYALLLIVGLLWAGLGYYIFKIGLSENPIAIAAFVVSLGILILGATLLNKLLSKIFLKSTLQDHCASKGYAIEVGPPGITFSFFNDKYVQLFLSANAVTKK